MRTRKSSFLAAGLLPLLATGAAPAPAPAKLPVAVSPATTVITAPLLPDGSPDYLATLNDRFGKGVTPDTNALIPLLQLFGPADAALLVSPDAQRPALTARFLSLAGLKEAPPSTTRFEQFADYLRAHNTPFRPTEAADQLTAARLQPWTADKFPALAEYLQAQAPAFALAADAAARPHFYVPFVGVDNHLANGASLRYTGWATLARAWCARAALRAGSGDVDGALADLVHVKQLGHLLPQSGTILSLLLGIIFDSCATHTAAGIISAGALTAPQIDAFAKGLALPPFPSIERGDLVDRWSSLDRFLLLAAGKLNVDAEVADKEWAARLHSIDAKRVDWNAVLTTINATRDRETAAYTAATFDEMNRLAAALTADVAAWKTQMQREVLLSPLPNETPAAYSNRIAHAFILFRPDAPYLSAEQRSRMANVNTALLQVLLAAAREKAQSGRWPATLPPAAVRALPADPFSAGGKAPLEYSLHEGHPTASSVGPDRTWGTSDDLTLGGPPQPTSGPRGGGGDLP
jgi:hypothetical protein